tara:strand:- start:654 stop:1286 length:633 start_codon:yes stop_codon:yes gene_type:complete
MHKINVLIFGSKNFNTSLEELKDFFIFRLGYNSVYSEKNLFEDYDILLVHEDYLDSDKIKKKEFLSKNDKIKILISNTSDDLANLFQEKLSLPFAIKDLNKIVEDSFAKKNFNQNSSIKIKDYILDKNEKKLIKDKAHIFLTEKEIQLLELLLLNKCSVNKDKILKKVWNYADDADTHTVETHIYRLRKKIKNKFFDESFILNDKEGYLL